MDLGRVLGGLNGFCTTRNASRRLFPLDLVLNGVRGLVGGKEASKFRIGSTDSRWASPGRSLNVPAVFQTPFS